MKTQLETWQHDVETALPSLDEVKGLDQLRVKYLGKRGLITLAVREIGKLPPAERQAPPLVPGAKGSGVRSGSRAQAQARAQPGRD